MRRNTLILLILLSVTTSQVDAGWFSRNKEKEKAPEVLEREQRIQSEERLKAAQQRINTQEERIDGQEATISKLRWTNTLALTGAVVLLIIGVAMGSTTRRDEGKS